MPEPRDEVWVVVKLTPQEAQEASHLHFSRFQHDTRACDEFTNAIRAALSRKVEAWVGWEGPSNLVGGAVVTPHETLGSIRVLVVPLEEEP